MATTPLPDRSSTATEAPPAWPLELDAERCVGGSGATAERLASLVRLVMRTRGVDQAAASTHCGGCHLRVGVTLAAPDLPTAVERAALLLRSCALDAGLGPVILVSVRVAPPEERGLRAG